MKLAVGLVLVLIVSIAVIALLIAKQPTPRYFAATPDLRLAPLIPLDKPVLTQQGLLNWVTETISNAVSLDFLEWREKLSKTRENFEETAYKSFLASLKSSGILDMKPSRLWPIPGLCPWSRKRRKQPSPVRPIPPPAKYMRASPSSEWNSHCTGMSTASAAA